MGFVIDTGIKEDDQDLFFVHRGYSFQHVKTILSKIIFAFLVVYWVVI